MKKLVIIDGKSVFYRGYYAMGHLAKADGTPTGGVYGFAVIAMEIVRKLSPDKVVVAWDKAGTSVTKRKAIYADYKAGRKKPPEDFFAQIPYLRELIAALGWGFLECDDYEADDIIGTLAKQADEETNWTTYIISSDLDMLQVVDENTRMYRVVKGFSQIEEIDIKAIEAKYGIKKNQFLDLKALKGDASDNIPGVPGVGEKSAVKLLNEFGNLDGIYENIDKISGALQKKLTLGKESAYMSYKLGKIMTDAPVSLAEIPDLVVNGPGILKVLKYLEFNSLIRKYQSSLFDSKSTTVLPRTTPSGLSSQASVVSDGPRRAIRSEEEGCTTSNWQQPAQCPQEENSARSDSSFQKREEEGISGSQQSDATIIISGDVKQEMHFEPEVAERILGGEKFWDLSQGAFLLNPLRRKKEFGDKMAEYWRQREEFLKVPKLYEVYEKFDLPLIPVLYKMERRGILIDKKYFEKLKEEYGKYVGEIEEEIYEAAGEKFNVNSPIQLSEVLYGKLGLPTRGIRKTTRGYSTGAKELEKLRDAHEVIPLLLKYREAAKLLSTYIVPLPELADGEGRIHTTFTQNVTATGRLSSVNPNLQNIPVRTEEGRRIRMGFVAGPGKVLISADYAQFELRLAAVLSGDKELIADFNSGVDIHTKTASEVFRVPMGKVSGSQRRAAKVINFGVLYGMSAKGLSEQTGMSVGEAKQFIEDYFKVRRPIGEYLDRVLEQARTEGYVETYFGRRRPTPDVKSPNFMVRTGAERAARNMPIQGTEADLMKRAMILVDGKLPEGAELVLQIHDSLVVECDEGKVENVSKVLRETMEGVAPELKIKLAVDVTNGKNWEELHA